VAAAVRFTGVTVAPVFRCYPHMAILSLRPTAPSCVMLRGAVQLNELQRLNGLHE
jgi:hypothetical protein